MGYSVVLAGGLHHLLLLFMERHFYFRQGETWILDPNSGLLNIFLFKLFQEDILEFLTSKFESNLFKGIIYSRFCLFNFFISLLFNIVYS